MTDRPAKVCPKCGGPRNRKAKQCKACRAAEMRLPAHRCRCGVVIVRSSARCQACRKAQGYMPAQYRRVTGLRVQANPTPEQTDFQLFLMQQRHRMRQGVRRMEQRIYARKAEMEMPQITPIIFKREALTVTIRGGRHHGGGKCGGHE